VTLRSAVEENLPAAVAPQQSSSAEPWLDDIKRMQKKGAGPQAIWDALRLEKPDFKASVWSVKRLCARLKASEPVKAADVAIPVETALGEDAQVDFGYVGRLYDPERGRLRKAWVFVMTLCYSRHQFCRVSFDQRADTWQELHVQAFEAFGGFPQTVVPDNLKAAVIRAAFGIGDNPSLNRSYRELAKHYGFKIDPTPPRDPKKKGRVESGVKYVKNNFFKPRELSDIGEANRELDRWVMEIAGKRVHGTTGRRPLEVFEQEEQPALQALPPTRFEPVVWKEAKVHADGQVSFERRLYPVPWRLIGQQVWLRATARSVAVYANDERVATHDRGKPVPREVRDSYLPPERTPYRHRSRAYWEERADHLGEEVGRFIREVFDSDDALSMLRHVQSIVTHLEAFPAERRTAACRRASYFGNYTYRGVRDILRKALDREPLPGDEEQATAAVEELPRFARSIGELLQLPLEVRNECDE
jgi:transposase